MSLLGFVLAMSILSSVSKSEKNDSSERSENDIFTISDNMTEEQWRMFYATLE